MVEDPGGDARAEDDLAGCDRSQGTDDLVLLGALEQVPARAGTASR